MALQEHLELDSERPSTASRTAPLDQRCRMSFDEMFPTTRRSYAYLLKDYVYPTFGKLAVPAPTIQSTASASSSL